MAVEEIQSERNYSQQLQPSSSLHLHSIHKASSLSPLLDCINQCLRMMRKKILSVEESANYAAAQVLDAGAFPINSTKMSLLILQISKRVLTMFKQVLTSPLANKLWI